MRAVVDIGSNSVKYSVADSERGAIKNLHSRSWVSGLGRGLDKNKILHPESVAKTIQAFREMQQELGALSLESCRVVATAAVRECRNPELIADAVKKIFGVDLQILTGDDEARLSMQGAAAAAKQATNNSAGVFIDVGGASTEVGVLQPTRRSHSFFAGALRCHEALKLGEGAIGDELWSQARSRMDEFFPHGDWDPLSPALFAVIEQSPQAIAVGGTLVMAAKMAAASHPEVKIYSGFGVALEARHFTELNEHLRGLTLNDRKKIPGIYPDRADIVCAGILVLTHLLEKLTIKNVFVTEWGLRHGLLLD